MRWELRFVPDNRVVATLDLPLVEGYVIGRSDGESDYVPDIDLLNFQARTRGVSRRHVALVSYRGQTALVDLRSVNGTFLNGAKCEPDIPYPINIGDEIRLAQLSLIIGQI